MSCTNTLYEVRDIDFLRPDDSNPRKPDASRLHLLRLSLSKLGFILPIAITPDGMVLSGHQRLTVAKQLGFDEVPVQVVELSDKDIKGINILFNRRLAVTEPVATPSGWVSIGDVQVGDYIFGRDGLPHVVTDKTEVEKRQMYTVLFDDGTEVLADAEHLWTVEFTGKSQTKYVDKVSVDTLEVAKMLVEDNRRVRVPLVDPLCLPERSYPVDPWVLGVLLGDGSLSTHGVRWHTSAPIEWAKETMLSLLPEGTKVKDTSTPGRSVRTLSLGGGDRGGVMHNSLLEVFRSLGLSGKTAVDKFVPEQFMWGSKEQRLSLLRGLMDSDGCAVGRTPVFTTVSSHLADAVVHLALSLGGKAGKRVMRGQQGEWSKAYQVTVRLPKGMCPFSRPDRVSQFSVVDARLHRRVVSVTQAAVCDAVCISIDSDEHLYLTRNFVPTHNCTNDFGALDTGSSKSLQLGDIIEEAEKLEDFESSEFWPVWQAEEISIEGLGKDLVDVYDKKSIVVADNFIRKGIKIPIVVSTSGKVVNGVHRLLAAREKGIKDWPVVTVSDAMADFALHFLNYLSMDFHVDEQFANVLRYSAYRRPQNNRGSVPKAYRFWANGERTLLDRDSYSTDYWRNFRDLHGKRILDFGSGLSKVAPFLQNKGINCIDFEPYRIDPSSATKKPDPEYSRQKASEFLDTIEDPAFVFDSIFLASVLNSIPFPRDRMAVLAIVHGLCGFGTTVYGTARDISDFTYEYSGIRQANYFVFDSESGVRLGDTLANPKIQKFHSMNEMDKMLHHFWKSKNFWKGGNVFYWRAKAPKRINTGVLAQALDFEFENLPYSDGSRMGLGKRAKEAFSNRLGVKVT